MRWCWSSAEECSQWSKTIPGMWVHVNLKRCKICVNSTVTNKALKRLLTGLIPPIAFLGISFLLNWLLCDNSYGELIELSHHVTHNFYNGDVGIKTWVIVNPKADVYLLCFQKEQYIKWYKWGIQWWVVRYSGPVLVGSPSIPASVVIIPVSSLRNWS